MFNGPHKSQPITCSQCGDGFESKLTSKTKANAFCSQTCKQDFRLQARRLDYKKKLYELFHGAKHRSNKRDSEFDLTLDFLESLWIEQDGRCSVSHFKFDWQKSGSRNNPNAPTIDRIDSKRGYTKDNIRLVTYHVNIAINEWGLDQFLLLAKAVTDER